MRPEHAPAIVAARAVSAAPPDAPEPEALPRDLPFFARQTEVVLANAGLIDPERIEEYVADGGYRALHGALTEMTPARGGAGDDAAAGCAAGAGPATRPG